MVLDNFTYQEIRKAIKTDYRQLTGKRKHLEAQVYKYVKKNKIKNYHGVFNLQSKSRNNYKVGIWADSYGEVILDSFSLFYRFYNKPRLIYLTFPDSDTDEQTLNIFTYHFIKRYSERLGLNTNSNLTADHIVLNSLDLYYTKIERHTYFTSSKQGYCFARYEEPDDVLILKTFLNPEILSEKQQRFYDRLCDLMRQEDAKFERQLEFLKVFKRRNKLSHV